ncbi:sugar phosphate isomerase/epimerase family protein [Terriglobus tenax]|uniref:sugar phosphate isomerase/epimerase family protein n=1 Tax=Terriglobus tenax TaxID=1111115 RepID=UPI0021E07717|nr:sugar phosphate isomerase/epimerase [Terriglobus tenax]
MSTRREVLKMGGLAAAGLMAPRIAMAKGAAPVKLGIASYTFRKFTPDQLIGFMHEIKTPYLNLKDVHLPMTPADAAPKQAAVYRAAGLQLRAAGTIYFLKDEDEDIRQKFEYVKSAGIPVIVGSPTHEALGRVESFVKKYDIKLAIHNHGPEDKEWPSPHDILKHIGKMDKRMGCCVDVGHALRAGDDIPSTLREVGPRLFNMHVKDLADPHKKESQCDVGDGVMPFRKIFETIIAMKYDGDVDLEYEINGDNPLPGVLKSFAFMRKTLSEMGYSA